VDWNGMVVLVSVEGEVSSGFSLLPQAIVFSISPELSNITSRTASFPMIASWLDCFIAIQI